MRRMLAVGALVSGLALVTTSVAVAQADPSAIPSLPPGAVASTAPAQEPAPYRRLCEVFGPAAVSAALGGGRVREERAMGTDQACRYSPRGGRNFTDLTATVNELDQETYVYGDETADSIHGLLKLNYPDAIETEVAGLPALRQPIQRLVREARGWRFGQLYIVPDRTHWMYLAVTAPRGVDVDDALVQLAELAVPRVFASVGAPEPSSAPEASSAPEPSESLVASASPEASGSPGAS